MFCIILFHILGESKVLSSISSEVTESLQRLINIDRNRPLDKRVLPDHFHENQVCISITELIIQTTHNAILLLNQQSTNATYLIQLTGDIDPDHLQLLASITPFLNVSPQCFNASRFYLENLIGNDEPPLWAIKRK